MCVRVLIVIRSSSYSPFIEKSTNLNINMHHTLTVKAAYLGNIAVDNAMPVIHNKVIQVLVGNVIKRTIFARKHHAVISAHLLK